MAFVLTDMHAIGGTTGTAPTLYMYTTADTIATVNTAQYFNSAAATLNVNDVIIVASSTGGTPVLTITYVNSNDGTDVDVVDGLTITATDTD